MTQYAAANGGSGISSKPKTHASPYKVLQEMSTRGISGSLTIHDVEDLSNGWKIFMTSERLTYATSASGKEERLPYLLQRFCPKLVLSQLEVTIAPHQTEYDDFNRWCRTGRLPLDELRRLLLRSSQDALCQALAINKASVQFSKGQQPDPIVLSVPLKDITASVRKSMKQWERVRPQIPSAFARLELNPQYLDQFCEHWEQSLAGAEALVTQFLKTQQMSGCMRLLTQKLTLYEAATTLKTEPLVLATWLHPLVESGTLSILPFKEAERRVVIACIDDSKTVQRQVQLTLQVAGYEVLSITEPAHALTALVRKRPALILMDVNMPEIDGYELSRMLRQSKQLRDIPIVMLTGRDGFLDRIRAQILRVNEYLTKPFEPTRLLQTVQKLALTEHSEAGEAKE